MLSAAALTTACLTWSAGSPAQAISPPAGAAVGSEGGCKATVLTITGTPGDDVLVGGKLAETIKGMGGDDTINGGGGADILDGGPGIDTLSGEAGNDCLFGGLGDDDLRGGDGDDYLDGGVGFDHLNGGPGSDTCVWVDGDICADTEWIRY